MKQLWIIIVACVGFVLFSAWAALFTYCLCRRYRRRKSNNNFENIQWHAKPTKLNDDIEMFPHADGLCQDTLKRASRRFKRPEGHMSANQEQPTNTTTAVVNGGFVYNSDEVDKTEDNANLPSDETKTDNYPDIIAAAEQSGVPDVVVNTTELSYKTDSLAVPEYRKPTLVEKIDNSPDFHRKLELPDNHLLQETDKSSPYQTLLVNGRSLYDSLHYKDRTSNVDDLAITNFKPVQRTGSAPSLVSRDKLMTQKQKGRKQVSRSSSLNSILESDFESDSTMGGSLKTLTKHKKSKRRRKPLMDESYQKSTKFSFFAPDSAGNDSAFDLDTTKSDNNDGKETDNTEQNVENETLSDLSSTTVDANEKLNFVAKDLDTDTHIQLDQVPLNQEKITSHAGLAISVLITDPIDISNEETDDLQKEEDTQSAPANGTDDLQFSELQSASSQEPTAEPATRTLENQMENAALAKQSFFSVSNTSSKDTKTSEEGKSSMKVDVKMAKSDHARIIRTASWATDGGAEIEEIEDNNSKSHGQGSDNDKKKTLKSQDLLPPSQQSRKIANLIDRLKEKQVDALHDVTAKPRDQRESENHRNEGEVVELKITNVDKETEKIQSNENAERNSASRMLIIQPEKQLVLTELLKKTKVIEHGTTKDLPTNAAISTKVNPLSSQARKRQFNFAQAPYTATGIGLNPVMSELLTRVTDNQSSKQSSGSKYEGEESIPNSHNRLTTAENMDNLEDNSSPKVKSVIPEAPLFVEPVSKWKSVASSADPNATATTANKKVSVQGPLRPDGGPAPITGAALVSIMPELQNRLRRISDQQNP